MQGSFLVKKGKRKKYAIIFMIHVLLALMVCSGTGCHEPSVDGIQMTGNSSHVNGTVSYSCSSGYEIVGQTDLVCLVGGHWDTTSYPRCEPATGRLLQHVLLHPGSSTKNLPKVTTSKHPLWPH